MSEPQQLPVVAEYVDFGNTRIFCPKCGESKDLTQFPLLPGNKIGSECMACIRQVQAERNLRRRELLANRVLGQYLQDTQQAGAKTPRMNPLLEELFNRFDGTAGFVDRFARQLEEAESQAPGSKQVLDAYKGIMQLVQANEKALPVPVDIGELSDDEIQKLIQREVHQGLQTLEQDIDDDDAAEPPI